MKREYCLKDIDIRKEIHSFSTLPFYEKSNYKVIDELVVGLEDARIDIAAIGNSFYGLEIKSDVDSFYRLPSQIDAYNRIFDFLYLVVGDRFLEKAFKVIPDWWGLVHVFKNEMGTSTEIVRKATRNVSVNKYSLANMLWKNEMILLLNSHNAERGLTKKERETLAQQIVEELSLEELQDGVRKAITQRIPERSVEQQIRYADLHRSGPRSLGFRERNLAAFLSHE